MENMPAPESVLEMMVCECQKLACKSMWHCWVLGLECTDLCKCSGSFNNETEANNMKSEIYDENDDNSEPSEASDANSEEGNG